LAAIHVAVLSIVCFCRAREPCSHKTLCTIERRVDLMGVLYHKRK
jgi:hypothetical protein